MFSKTILVHPQNIAILRIIPLIILLLVVEWIQRKKQHGLEIKSISSTFIRWSVYYILILIIILFGGQQQSFIYFQF